MPPTTSPADQLQELLWNFASHRVITVAGRTGLLARLAEREGQPAELAAELGLDPLATTKFVRALTALGLLEARAGSYRVTEELRPRLAPGPESFVPFIEHAHQLYDRWGESLEDWLRGQGSAVPRGGAVDPQSFGAAMQAIGAYVTKQVTAALNLSGVRRMLDVGGSFGHYAQAFCRVEPELTATVLDRPEVTALAQAALASSDLAGRIQFQGGDYLTADYGTGYDLVLEANILHQESAEGAAGLVARGAAALVPGGRLVVVDFAIDDEQQAHPLGTLFAINMRSFGDTYPEPTIRGWMKAAGLTAIVRRDLSPLRWLIIGTKPV